jgi:hypothetical protein
LFFMDGSPWPGFFYGTISTKTVFSGISYEKSVQEKDPGNHVNSGYSALGIGWMKRGG